MILYYKGAFGFNLLLRLRGSAVVRGMILGFISVVVFFVIQNIFGERPTQELAKHPYAFGVLVSSVSFLIVFRANHGYSRYWEACGAIHQMMSKWMDAATHMGSYHLQCDHYLHIKPPSFYNFPELNQEFYTMDRTRGQKKVIRSLNRVENVNIEASETGGESFFDRNVNRETSQGEPVPLLGKARLDGGWSGLFEKDSSTYYKKDMPWNSDGEGFASTAGGRTPALFLQELAHLCSLLNAVALSTLRCDIEGAEAPLDVYQPGSPWPEADPDMITGGNGKFEWNKMLKYYTGSDRTPEDRTRYNASRPLSVIGGVSDAEIRFLQTARGPYAKTQLCWQWLSEFIIREHIAGSTGKVGAPIISRVAQFLSDGMLGYNHARKIMYIPFPFPHAQMSVFYIIFMVIVIPLMMDEITTTSWLAAILTFLSTTCLCGLHEVARELENPFRNIPNDLPINTFQAFFNEALFTMYSGYHPDLFWDTKENTKKSCQSAGEADNAEVLSGKKAIKPKESSKCLNNNIHESSSPRSDIIGLADLRSLIDEQGREIERLRKIVEKK